MARNPIIREHPTKALALTDETPHACMDGWVFLGLEVEDASGEYVEVIEVIERVPCRRCNPESV